MYNKIEFIYNLNNDLECEIINTENSYLLEILEGAEKYYSVPNISNNIKVKGKLALGNYAFYLLDLPNLNFDEDIILKLELIKSFLSYCIENDKYCNNKIFLTFVRYILKINKLPIVDIFATDKSNISNETELNEKLKFMLDNIENIEIQRSYECHDIVDLIIISIFEIFSKEYSIKKCRNCHKYFFNRNSNKYCSYTSPQNSKKTCYEYCNDISYVKKRKENPIRKKYTEISNMLRSRCRYHDRESDWEVLRNFGDDYQIKMQDLNNGKISKEDVLNFLDSSKIQFENEYKKKKEERKNGSSRNNKK